MPRRIDSHQHFWRYRPTDFGWIDDTMAVLRRDFLPRDLEPELAAGGLDGCIAVQAGQSLDETKFLLGLAATHPRVLGVVGWVDLQSPDIAAQLREVAANPRLVGVRHIAQSEPDPRFLISPAVVRGIEALAPHDLTYDVLVYPHQLPAAVELVARLPQQRFVLDHCAKPDLRGGDLTAWSAHIRALAQHPNVTCKLSGLATEAPWASWTLETLRIAFDTVLSAFGPERLMFGSDWPVCLCATSYARWVETVHALLAPLPAAARTDVWGGTAGRLYPRLLAT
ncbi:MAG: amidohydrolase family protein [Planctomycetota bacterium]